ncbi:hypothetical protein MNB_ARC-1_202 [hydrothermal vent metagenome]|uniref:Nitrous oxide reductase maturation protein, outer-membrane lipoprotein NosL n=1 Tax=hydrothermal vent metagenome TaxID=652676 RepID=A0A3B1E784_9ZZZZ
MLVKKMLLLLLFVFIFGYGSMFQTVPLRKATMIQANNGKIYCSNCGMHLGKFYKTNHIHKKKQYCSMHCLVQSNKNNTPTNNIKVVDVKSLKFINALKAFYVVGSAKKGTMTVNSKYAFSTQLDAKTFQSKNGGKIMNFKNAFDEAKKDFKKDMIMIEKRKNKKIYKIGQKLFKTQCQHKLININDFSTISSLKSYIKDNDICGKKLQDKKLQAICVYIWDIEKLGKKIDIKKAIRVPKNAKCHTCGMFVAKHPKWVAKINFMKNSYYFDGVKDMMKFIFNQHKDFKNIFVTNYYTVTSIEAHDAFYVIGSNIYGPMGSELIPFSSKKEAEEFKQNHGGKEILAFDEIKKTTVEFLDK